MSKNILLMYITKVSGHRQACVALERSLAKLIPDVNVKSLNGFKYVFPILETIVHTWYMNVIKMMPFIWEKMYDNPKLVKNSDGVQQKLYKKSRVKLGQLFDEFQPNTIICTQAFPCGMAADYKTNVGGNFTLIGVLTDYAPHGYWINEGVDYYIVPSQECKDVFIAQGVKESQVKVMGIPIRYQFGQEIDQDHVHQNLGLDAGLPTVLIMGGGQGLGPIKKVVQSLEKATQPLQMIVIAGTNKKLNAWLEKTKQTSQQKIVSFDYAENIHELMDVADVIVTKPGGMTTAECLAKGLPMVIVKPIPGQETRNTNFLLEQGMAIRVDEDEQIAPAITDLLADQNKLEAMKKAATLHGFPHCADNVAELVRSLTKE